MSLVEIYAIDHRRFDVLSVDIFDTILLRDGSSERSRFYAVAKLVARKLKELGYSVSTQELFRLRNRVHDLAYLAASVERPEGDATLSRMIELQVALLGLGPSMMAPFLAAELEVEQNCLTANRPLLNCLSSLRDAGKRVIAVSDTYLPTNAVKDLVSRVVGVSPIEKFYVSSDIGLTKCAGRLFAHVGQIERLPLHRILHCGDNAHSDVAMARAAGFQAVRLARPPWMYVKRRMSAIRHHVQFCAAG